MCINLTLSKNLLRFVTFLRYNSTKLTKFSNYFQNIRGNKAQTASSGYDREHSTTNNHCTVSKLEKFQRRPFFTVETRSLLRENGRGKFSGYEPASGRVLVTNSPFIFSKDSPISKVRKPENSRTESSQTARNRAAECTRTDSSAIAIYKVQTENAPRAIQTRKSPSPWCLVHILLIY